VAALLLALHKMRPATRGRVLRGIKLKCLSRRKSVHAIVS
jgi:hypothetical protein